MTTDGQVDWVPDPRPVPEALTPEFQAEPYTDPWNSIMERLDHATRAELRLLYSGIGDPNVD